MNVTVKGLLRGLLLWLAALVLVGALATGFSIRATKGGESDEMEIGIGR
jgi:hypothetical protein